MRTPTAEIRQAFYGRLLARLPVGPVTANDVAWPNTGFRPDAGRVYIAPAVLFAETEVASLSPAGFELLQGIFQIGVFGLAGHGEGQMDGLAAAFTDMFRGGAVIDLGCWQPVRIRKAWRSPLMREDGKRPYIAVSAAWRQYTQKGD